MGQEWQALGLEGRDVWRAKAREEQSQEEAEEEEPNEQPAAQRRRLSGPGPQEDTAGLALIERRAVGRAIPSDGRRENIWTILVGSCREIRRPGILMHIEQQYKMVKKNLAERVLLKLLQQVT